MNRRRAHDGNGPVVVSARWDASLLTQATGANVELRIIGTTGGSGGNRRALEVGAVEWNAQLDASTPASSGGLHFLRARYYDPSTGRFASKDPIEFAQRYSYVGGNPVLYVDPSGLVGQLPSPARMSAKEGTPDLRRCSPAATPAQNGFANPWSRLRATLGLCDDPDRPPPPKPLASPGGRALERGLDPVDYCTSNLIKCIERGEVAATGAAVISFGGAVGAAGCYGGVVAFGWGALVTCPVGIGVGGVTAVAGGLIVDAAFQPWGHERSAH